MKRRTRFQLRPGLPWIVHAGSLLPLALLVFDFFTRNLTANPIQEATLRTGKTALVLLVLSLACTPLSSVFQYKAATRVRRPLGLYAFLYASLHFLIFIWVDLGLNWDYIREGFLQKPYALVGFAAFSLLIPLAITSTKGWQRRLGKAWKRLHALAYLAGVLVIVHYVWLVKSDVREPLLWGAGLSVLFLLRVGPVKNRAREAVGRLGKRFRSSRIARAGREADSAGPA